MQGSKGYSWIGTKTSLQRYVGKRFTNYLSDVHDRVALHSDWISALYEDSKHPLWVGTSLGVACLFNRNTGKFYIYNTHLTPGNKKAGGIWQFLEDRQGVTWIAAYDGTRN